MYKNEIARAAGVSRAVFRVWLKADKRRCLTLWTLLCNPPINNPPPKKIWQNNFCQTS